MELVDGQAEAGVTDRARRRTRFAVGCAVAAVAIASCGGDSKPDYHAKVKDAVAFAQVMGDMNPDADQDTIDAVVDSLADACAGDRTAETSVRLSINDGGKTAQMISTILEKACPGRLAEITG